MNILKKALAPLTDKAWDEITEQAGRITKEYLTGRKIVDIDGPNGLAYGAISTGRLTIPPNQSKTGVNYGIREVIPLLEVRKPFTLDLWELDNASRNAEDINLDNLEDAAKEIAAFEDRVFYYGFEAINAPGLFNAMEGKVESVDLKAEQFTRTIAEQVVKLRQRAVEGPYSLVLPAAVWTKLTSQPSIYPVIRQLKDIIGGDVIIHHENKDVFLVSERGGDFELSIGQDISIGYDGHDSDKVKLYFTESFMFRTIGPEAFTVLKPQV
jgi:uncharacterized linocin/CFP29 family protein